MFTSSLPCLAFAASYFSTISGCTCAPKLARKNKIKNWFSCVADGRALGRSVYGYVITKFSVDRFS